LGLLDKLKRIVSRRKNCLSAYRLCRRRWIWIRRLIGWIGWEV